ETRLILRYARWRHTRHSKSRRGWRWEPSLWVEDGHIGRRWRRRHSHCHPWRHPSHRHWYWWRDDSLLWYKTRWRRWLCECSCELALVWSLIPRHWRLGTKLYGRWRWSDGNG